MRTAVIVVSLIAAIAAEAPYHLPRPGANSPGFHYPQAPPPVRPQPPPPPPQQNFVPGSGYFYQQPSIQPAFVQPPQPQYQPAPQPQYRPQPQFQPAPQPQYQPAPQHHHHHPAPQPQYQPAPQPQYQPAPQPQYQPAPQTQYQPAPQPQYQPAPQPQYQPAPQPQYQPAPQPLPVYQQPAPQPLPVSIPSTSYGVPETRPAFSQPLPQPIRPLPAFIAPQPQPQPQPAFQPAVPYQQSSQQGYSYPQPLSAQLFPLQSQSVGSVSSSSGLSSYQADSNQYSGAQAQVHGEALDSLVVDRVQNIIKENEHSSARDAGYLSLVSGVSLENAKPSIEISSFVHSAPLTAIESSSSLGSSSSSSASSAVSAPSSDYGLPTITANSQSSQSGSSSSSLGFLPNSKPATSYGPPN